MTPELRSRLCKDCGVDTFKIEEYYMVADEVWRQGGLGAGMLCIGCLEERIGRKLKPDDFPELRVNDRAVHVLSSARLKNRLGID